MATEQDLRAIAEGRQPTPWEATFEHPVFGSLTFRAKMPNALMLAAQSVEMDNLLAALNADASPRMGTLTLVAAIAGLSTLVELPVVRERRVEDEDDPARLKIERVRYDPKTEIDETFLATVWWDYSRWRNEFLTPENQGELKNSSGETAGDDSNESSSDSSVSPSTIPV